MSVWSQLSTVSVNDHTEQKGQFTYLGWTFAWAEVKSRFPDATYTIEPENKLPDGSMEVRTTVTIQGETLPMWLAVTDFNNKAIKQPNSADVANSRMRCLTKNLAMFGLGFYIYAGESMPMEPTATDEQWKELLSLVAAEDAMGLRVFSDNVGPEVMTQLFNNAEQGKKTAFKDQVRDLYKRANAMVSEYDSQLTAMIAADDEHGLNELWSELSEAERHYVRNTMSQTDVHKLEGLINE